MTLTSPKSWKMVQLSDVAKVNELTITSKYTHDQIEYVDVASVSDRAIQGVQKLSLVDAPSRAKRIVRDNDILISTVRPSLKHFCFVKNATENLVASTGFAVISAKQADPLFLYYYLTSDPISDYLSKVAEGHTSAYPSFNPSVLEKLEIPIPESIDEQSEIATILGSLDDKIELLRAQNKTLESIAQAMFKEWFVESDFSETFNLEEIIDFDPKVKISKNEKYLFYDMKSLSDSSMSVADGIYRAVSSGSIFQPNDTLLAKITPCLENGKTGFVFDIKGETLARGSTEFIVMRAKNSISQYFVYCLARSEDFRDHAIKSMSGTSGRQRVQVDQIKKYEININKETMNKFHNVNQATFNKISNNQKEIQTLLRLRDELLNKIFNV